MAWGGGAPQAGHNKTMGFIMSEAQYTRISRTRLKDLKRLPASRLLALLSTRPEWLRDAVLKNLMRTNA